MRVWLAVALAGTVPAVIPHDAGAGALFTVNATGDQADIDTTDDLCDAAPRDGRQCTLRAAIQQANATLGTDTIIFDIVGGTAPLKTISPASPLPTIVEAVTIDGYTQSGASPNTRSRGNDAVLRIQLNGTNAGEFAVGLSIDASNTVVMGLVINRFDRGIRVTGSNNRIEGNFIGTNPAGTVDLGNRFAGINISSGASNVIGGPTRSARNLISGNDDFGVYFSGSTIDNVVVNNYIGTRRDGNAALGNSLGVGILFSDDHIIGGTSSRLRNVISGNSTGVHNEGSGTEILGNFIGTNAAGTAAVPNTSAGVVIWQGSQDNTVGGTAPGAGNVISGNSETGLYILNEESTGNVVQGNRIGTNAAGTAALGNGANGIFIRAPGNTVGGSGSASNLISGNAEHGVLINGGGEPGVVTGNEVTGNAITANGLDGVQINSGASRNLVFGNAIIGNGDDGVSVDILSTPPEFATGNRILSNQIIGNAALGIDLVGGTENGFGVTANDTDDPDTGSNNLQNFPVIVSATRSDANGVTTILGTLNSNPNQSFTIQFFLAAQDDSDHGEGQVVIGQTDAATNANGDDGFSFFTTGLVVGQRITATATNTATGDTSEFSLNRIVTPGP